MKKKQIKKALIASINETIQDLLKVLDSEERLQEMVDSVKFWDKQGPGFTLEALIQDELTSISEISIERAVDRIESE